MNEDTSSSPVLEMENLCKAYAGVPVVKDLDISIARGEVRALMGVNGAGKSTLVKILGGVVERTSGTIRLDGQPFEPHSPAAAQHAGISIVHQELSTVPGLTVAENITMGRWPLKGIGPIKMISTSRLEADARAALDLLGEDIPLRALVGELSPAKQQLVEIAKALVSHPKVLILDEPTSSLAAHEVDGLLALVRRLGEQEVAVIYVSHRMGEIPKVAHSVTVLRDGQVATTRPIAEMNTAAIAESMVGRELATRPETAPHPLGETVLDVEHLTVAGVVHDVSFQLREGDVLGLVGLMGSGRTEILRALFGVDSADGAVTVRGKRIRHRTPRRMIAAGVGFTPEDRKGQGLVLGLSVSENLVMTCYERLRDRWGTLSAKAQRAMADDSIRSQSVSTSSPELPVGLLSGGNQQKVVIGKWLNRGAEILLMDEPTRGVDVHAKNQTYDTVTALAERGGAAVFVSSEVEEVFLVCNRVLVVRDGRIVAERRVEDTSPHELLALSMKEEVPA